MIRRALPVLAVMAILVGASAQTPTPAAYTDPHVYSDPGMRVAVPDGYRLMGMRHIDPADLTEQMAVAVWRIQVDKEESRTIVVSVEPYDGFDLSGFEQVTENSLRGSTDGLLIDSKVRTTTANGMPAYFMAITTGSGFDAMRRYQYIWTDGVRGVTVAIAGRLSEISAADAKAALGNISAVAYPKQDSQ
jgi:hypothetical protein